MFLNKWIHSNSDDRDRHLLFSSLQHVAPYPSGHATHLFTCLARKSSATKCLLFVKFDSSSIISHDCGRIVFCASWSSTNILHTRQLHAERRTWATPKAAEIAWYLICRVTSNCGNFAAHEYRAKNKITAYARATIHSRVARQIRQLPVYPK